MARIHYVQKARKDQGVCDKCRQPLLAGSPYKWVGLRPSGPGSHLKKKRCATCPTWRASELSFSKMSQIYAAMETWEDFLDSNYTEPDEVREALEDVANQVRETAEEYRESAQNMEDGFGHSTYMSEELNEKADTLEAWADEIESAEVPELDDYTQCEECGATGQVDCETCDGTGELDRDEPGNEDLEDLTCDECAGEGQVDCDECDGTGENPEPDLDGWHDEVAQISEPNDCPV